MKTEIEHSSIEACTPSPWMYFWVPIALFTPIVHCQAQQRMVEHGGVVIPMHELERPYGSNKPSLQSLFAAIECVICPP